MCIYIYVYISIYICVYMCIYIYIYIREAYREAKCSTTANHSECTRSSYACQNKAYDHRAGFIIIRLPRLLDSHRFPNMIWIIMMLISWRYLDTMKPNVPRLRMHEIKLRMPVQGVRSPCRTQITTSTRQPLISCVGFTRSPRLLDTHHFPNIV